MAWLAKDKDGMERIFQFRPRRYLDRFISLYPGSMELVLPAGSIKKLIDRDLDWKDEPVEYKEE